MKPPESPPENPMATSHKVRVRGLKAWFGSNEVLHGIDMDISARGVTAIIGPSGCGKSTFIRCLNRMHELVAGAKATGSVELDGEDADLEHE